MKIQKLKQDTKYFDQQRDKIKKFEVRINDRNYQVGDILELKRYHKKAGYLKSFIAFSMSHGLGTYYEQCPEEEADTLKIRVTSVTTAKMWNNPIIELPEDIKQEVNDIILVLHDYFKVSVLPESHVILGTEIIK